MDKKMMAVKMKEAGLGNSLIAKRLGLAINTVQKYVENVLSIPAKVISTDNCLYCGKELNKTKADKKFCSRECRYKWWKNNKIYSQSKAVEAFKCKHCGKTFVAYGDKGRKYCCYDCYIKDRFGDDKGIV